MASTNITTFPGKVGISNANPTHTLAIGSNVYVDDTGINKLVVLGSISTTGTLSGDGSGLNNIQSSNVIGLTDNVTRIETLETDLTDNVARIGTLETDLGSNVTRIENLESGDITITGTKTFQDDVILESNLRVQGDLLVANTVNMTVSDPILELGSNNLNTGDIGLVMTRHGASNSNVAVFFDETADTLKLGYTLNGAGDSTLEFDSNALAVSVQGALTAASLSGDGSGLTSLNASNVSSGTLTRPISTTTGTFSGNVGIGTTNPSSKLHVDNGVLVVKDTPETNPTLLLPDGDGTGAFLNQHIIGNTHVGVAQFVSEQDANTSTIAIINKDRDSNTTKNASIGFYNTDTTGKGKYAGKIGFWPADANAVENEFRVYTTNTVTSGAGYDYPQQRFVIDKDGNVGIGTANPSTKLHVYEGSGVPIFRLQSNGDAQSAYSSYYNSANSKAGYCGIDGVGMFGQSNGALALGTNDTPIIFSPYYSTGEKMRITTDGNVGIGTTNPQSKLNVRGTISTGRNLAREVGSVISYSSQYTAARGAANVISGKKNQENGDNDWITANGQRDNANVVIDLGATYAVDRLVIYNQNEYTNSRREVKGFKLQGSTNNSTWDDVITSECGRSNGHEPNPGWSFRIPQNWDDDDEGTSYRYWRFIMTSFHGTDNYGGIMELELYEASDALDDEVSTSSLVAEDVYSETGNFSRGVTIGRGYAGTSTGENNLIVEGSADLPTIVRSPHRKELANEFYLLSGSSGTANKVLLQIDTNSSADTDQSEYAGTIDLHIVAQRTQASYHVDCVNIKLNFCIGWNEQTNFWQILEFNQENKIVYIDGYKVLTSVPIFKYKYVDRQLQIYVSYNYETIGAWNTYVATVSGDGVHDITIVGEDTLMASGTDGTAVLGVCYGTGGNVGIGTADPYHQLHVNTIMGISPPGSSLGLTSQLAMYATFASGTSDTGPRRAADIRTGFATGTWGNEYMSFHVGKGGAANDSKLLTNERMRIAGNGNVGIGTASPGTPLDIYNSTGGADTYALKIQTNDTATASAGALGPGIGFYTRWWSGGGVQIPHGAIHAIKTEANGTSGGGLAFRTGHDSGADMVTNMVIDGNGNVGIGKTDPLAPLDIGAKKGSILSTSLSSLTSNASMRITGTAEPADALCIGMLGTDTGNDSGNNPYAYIQNIWDSTPATGRTLLLNPAGGNVGIGTASPLAKLQVIGTGNINMAPASRQYFRYDYNGVFGYTAPSSGYGWGDTSIYASYAIVSGDHFVSTNGTLNSSDTRIKKNIVDADDAECLETLRLLKPKKYQYKDEIERGTEPVWGFIAQEVRETLPYATQLRRDVLPNIYELANVSSSNVITFVNFNTSNLESNATTLIRTKGIDGEDHDVHLAEVIDEHTIRVEEDLTEWTGSVDETGNVVAGNQLFIYGQEVDDFVFLKKDAIWTVATSALQEVDRQLQAEKAKVATLETQLASVLARVDALENT